MKSQYGCDYRIFNYLSLHLTEYYQNDSTRDKCEDIKEWWRSDEENNDIGYQLFVADNHDTFIKHLTYSLAFQRSWFQYGSAEFFLLLPKNLIDVCFFVRGFRIIK